MSFYVSVGVELERVQAGVFPSIVFAPLDHNVLPSHSCGSVRFCICRHLARIAALNTTSSFVLTCTSTRQRWLVRPRKLKISVLVKTPSIFSRWLLLSLVRLEPSGKVQVSNFMAAGRRSSQLAGKVPATSRGSSSSSELQRPLTGQLVLESYPCSTARVP